MQKTTKQVGTAGADDRVFRDGHWDFEVAPEGLKAVIREDAAWSVAAKAFSEAKAALHSADTVLALHPKETGGGVSVTRFPDPKTKVNHK